jgi:hypothetical protein
VFDLIIDMMSLCTMHVWHAFAYGCNMLSVQLWLKKKKNIGSIIKTTASRTGTCARRIYMIVKMLRGFCPLAGETTAPIRLRWPWALEADHGPSPAGWFHILCLGCFSMSSFEVVMWRPHLEIKIRFSPVYSHFWRCV